MFTRYKYRKYTQQQKLKQNHLERKWVCLSVLNSPAGIRTLFCSVTSLKFSGKWTASKNTTNLLVSLLFTSINKSFFIAWLTEMFTVLYYTKYSARNNINIVAKLPHTKNIKWLRTEYGRVRTEQSESIFLLLNLMEHSFFLPI